MAVAGVASCIDRIVELLGDEADQLLNHQCQGIPRDQVHSPGPNHLDEVMGITDRNPRVLGSLARIRDHGRLAGTGYLSILPVDQGIEHSGAASFAPNTAYFDPENIVKLAVEGGCNAVASTLGVLGAMSRRWAHRIPFIVKLNHNEMLTYPNQYRQTLFANVESGVRAGCGGCRGHHLLRQRRLQRARWRRFQRRSLSAHELGLATILWCYLRNPAFKKDGVDYHDSADLTGQANHLGVTIQADIVKQKLPTKNGGYTAVLRQDP